MITIPFCACDEDLELIQAEQDRFAGSGIKITQSEAIRSLILRASANAKDAARTATSTENNGTDRKGMKFFVLPSEKTLNGRVEKVFID